MASNLANIQDFGRVHDMMPWFLPSGEIMSPCPCGSKNTYLACCGPFLTGKAIPETPEALMRSRYTAYSRADTAYIKKTMRGKPLVSFNEAEAGHWARSVTWVGLEVMDNPRKSPNPDQGFVEFVATYIDQGVTKTIHEISQFQLVAGAWFYVDGLQPPARKNRNVSRNAPCPCGSHRKFKNCHGKNT